MGSCCMVALGIFDLLEVGSAWFSRKEDVQSVDSPVVLCSSLRYYVVVYVQRGVAMEVMRRPMTGKVIIVCLACSGVVTDLYHQQLSCSCG
ncbi:hypothetical protein Taro_010929 [Colocasia esculenta]|uniref:Uncharacterized protein n=1 Tax=Colocasia esculenta TaxID=4460 RepID=A0A843U4Q0_COLES|nr:hypothetical protein [Colocasia esculenta]